MEDQASPTPATDLPLAQFTTALQAARSRTRELLDAQRRRLEEIEGELARHAQVIADELAEDRVQLEQRRTQVADAADAVDAQCGVLLDSESEWAVAQEEAYRRHQAFAEQLQLQRDELERREHALFDRERAWEAQAAELREVQRALDAAHFVLEDRAGELNQARLRIEEKLQACDAAQAALDQAEIDLKHQRRRIALELKAERQELQRERAAALAEAQAAALARAELEALESAREKEVQDAHAEADYLRQKLEHEHHQRRALEEELAAFHEQIEHWQVAHEPNDVDAAALYNARQQAETLQAALTELLAQVEPLRSQRDDYSTALAGANSQLDQLRVQSVSRETHHELELKLDAVLAEIRELKRRNAELTDSLAERASSDGGGELAAELAALRAERDALDARVGELETRPMGDSSLQKKLQDLQRRFEMAVDDLRELKHENQELKQNLADARQSAHRSHAHGGASESLDWESQKRKLLAALESFDEDSREEQRDRLTIEGTIHITDEVVAAKDREIAELQQLLDEQSSHVGGLSVGAAAIEAALNQDELVREERERLAKLKAEWEDKLRQAEIDLSVERAQLARQRAELELRAHSLQSEQAQSDSHREPGKPDKGARGRWLARLGLKEDEKK